MAGDQVCDADRRRLVRQAFRLEWLTIGWMAIEAVVAVGSGTAAHSLTLLADAIESAACFYLSGAVVIGLVAQWILGAWWIDAVTSLAIVYFLVKEGREAWLGDDCCDDAKP
jgi:divalent metal cation (Fe/Co/Zn/Cd) transporter